MKISIISRNQGIVEKELDALFEELHNVTALQNYSPFIFLGGHRRNETSTPIPLMVYDFDDDTLLTLKQAKELCSHFKSLVVTTRNHLVEKKGKTSERFRVLIPLDEAPPKEMYKRVYLTLAEMLGFKDAIDTQCTDLARYYFGNAKQEVFYSSSEKIITLKEIEAFITEQPNELPHSMHTMGLKINDDILDNELSSTFIFKNGRAFESYDYLQVGDTEPIRCFNHHHEDKHPSAFVGRSKDSGRLMVSCKTCNDVKFIRYETAPTTENEGINKSIKDDDIIAKNPLEMLECEAFTVDEIASLKDIKMLIKGFLPHNHITMFYAPSNIGKTTATMGLLNHILKRDDDLHAFYFDYDNGANTMKKHLVKVVQNVSKFKYVSFDKTPLTKLFTIIKGMYSSDLSNHIFVFDSLQHFVPTDLSSTKAEKDIKELFAHFKHLRTNGATIILLSHTTKEKDDNGKETTFRGLNVIKDNCDNMFYLTRQDNTRYVFECQKSRAEILPITSCMYNHSDVLIETFGTISTKEFNQIISEEKNILFIDTVVNILKSGNMIQKDLTTAIKDVDDFSQMGINGIINLLKLYAGKHWLIKKTGERLNKNTYSPMVKVDSGIFKK